MPPPHAHGRKDRRHRAGSLIPKVREQFAEFLDQDSLERFRILIQTTCVGLWYGRCPTSRRKLFSTARNHRIPSRRRVPSRLTHDAPRTCLGGGPHAWPATTTARAGYPSVSLLRCPTARRGPATARPHPPKGARRAATVSTPRLGSDGHTPAGEYRLPHPFDYACRPRLRTRLTRGRRA